MGARCSIHELSRDAHPALGLAHATFDDVPHTKLAADLLFVHRLAFVSKTRVASDHEQPADARQGGDDIFHDAVGKIILLGVAAKITATLRWKENPEVPAYCQI